MESMTPSVYEIAEYRGADDLGGGEWGEGECRVCPESGTMRLWDRGMAHEGRVNDWWQDLLG